MTAWVIGSADFTTKDKKDTKNRETQSERMIEKPEGPAHLISLFVVVACFHPYNFQ